MPQRSWRGERGRPSCCSSPLHAGPRHSSLLNILGPPSWSGTPKLVGLPWSGCCPPAHPDLRGRRLIPQPCPTVFLLPLGFTLMAGLGPGQCHLSYARLGNEWVIAVSTSDLQHLLLHFQTHAGAPGMGGDLSIRARLAVCCGSKGKGVLRKFARRDSELNRQSWTSRKKSGS